MDTQPSQPPLHQAHRLPTIDYHENVNMMLNNDHNNYVIITQKKYISDVHFWLLLTDTPSRGRFDKNRSIIPFHNSCALTYDIRVLCTTDIHTRPVSRTAVIFPAGVRQFRLVRRRAVRNPAGGGANLFRPRLAARRKFSNF